MLSLIDTNLVYYLLSLYSLFCSFGVESRCVLEPFFFNTAPVVDTTLGPVQGTFDCSRSLFPYFKYLGIAYAEPPIGTLRFEPPVPKTPWTAVRPANIFRDDCYQFDVLLLGHILGSEDCLFLNVFTPSVNPDEKYPVLVWIHGGGFTSGGSRMYIPSYLMEGQDIVVVSMNYRLGALGFLNTGDDLVRGNMGLKDQNMALKFVKKNIAQFGGDPNKITLFGESSGGASVHYHVISPLSRGLFHQAIMQSGNVFCPWAFTRNPKNQALKFGGMVQCPNRTTSELVACLKRMNPDDIVSQHHVLLSPVHTQDDVFAGSVEMGSPRSDTFLAENPFVMLNRGDFNRVPVIFGVNSAEGALKTARNPVKFASFEANPGLLRNIFDFEVWNDKFPILLHYNKELKNVSRMLLDHYFPEVSEDTRIRSNRTHMLLDADDDDDLEFSKRSLQNITKMVSDGVWFHATELAARNHSKFAPVYLNYFNYTSGDSFLPSSYSCLQYANLSSISEMAFWVSCVASGQDREYYIGNIFGACHTDDMVYYWAIGHTPEIIDFGVTRRAYEFSTELVATIASFVKQEKPLRFVGVEWVPAKNTSNPLQYMLLDSVGKMIYHPYQKGIYFIKSLKIWSADSQINN